MCIADATITVLVLKACTLFVIVLFSFRRCSPSSTAVFRRTRGGGGVRASLQSLLLGVGQNHKHIRMHGIFMVFLAGIAYMCSHIIYIYIYCTYTALADPSNATVTVLYHHACALSAHTRGWLHALCTLCSFMWIPHACALSAHTREWLHALCTLCSSMWILHGLCTICSYICMDGQNHIRIYKAVSYSSSVYSKVSVFLLQFHDSFTRTAVYIYGLYAVYMYVYRNPIYGPGQPCSYTWMLTEPPPLQSFLDGLMVALGQSPSLAALPYQCWTSGIIHYLILQHVCCTHTHTHTHT